MSMAAEVLAQQRADWDFYPVCDYALIYVAAAQASHQHKRALRRELKALERQAERAQLTHWPRFGTEPSHHLVEWPENDIVSSDDDPAQRQLRIWVVSIKLLASAAPGAGLSVRAKEFRSSDDGPPFPAHQINCVPCQSYAQALIRSAGTGAFMVPERIIQQLVDDEMRANPEYAVVDDPLLRRQLARESMLRTWLR